MMSGLTSVRLIRKDDKTMTRIYIEGFVMPTSCKSCKAGYYSYGNYYCGVGMPVPHRMVSDEIDTVDRHCPLREEVVDDDDLK